LDGFNLKRGMLQNAAASSNPSMMGEPSYARGRGRGAKGGETSVDSPSGGKSKKKGKGDLRKGVWPMLKTVRGKGEGGSIKIEKDSGRDDEHLDHERSKKKKNGVKKGSAARKKRGSFLNHCWKARLGAHTEEKADWGRVHKLAIRW